MSHTLEALHALRSVHGNFSERRIPEEELQEIIETCVLAANASNRQSYSIVVVDDPGRQKELTGYKGSATLVFCVDYNRIIDVAERLGHAYDVQGFPLFVAGMVDVCLAAQTAAVAAKAMGIDSLFTNGIHRGDVDRVYRLLDLPEAYCFPAVALVLGYAEGEPTPKRGRLHGPGVVHHDAYRRLSTDEIGALIARYDDPAERLDLGVPWKDKGFAHFLDWFYQVWSNPAQRPAGSAGLYDLFVRAGFTGKAS